jgi:2-dehydro-3-deoxygluconokinase
MTYDLTTFGEGQLRFTVLPGARLSDARSLRVCAAGSEANVAGLLAQVGRTTAWSTILPDGDLGERVLGEYRSAGVDLRHVVRRPGGRVATYYLEPAAGGLPARVAYDREGTALRTATPDDFDWDALLDTRCLFVTGITAALTDATAELVHFAVGAAASRGIPVALDVNHRTTLWSPDRARRVLEPLFERVWTVFCSRRDAKAVFGIDGEGAEVARELRRRSWATHVVTTDGADAVHYAGAAGERSIPVRPVEVRDRPGAGDALVGATLHGLLDDRFEDALRWGVRAAAIALGHDGDLTRLSPADLDAPAGTDIHR